MTSPFTRARSLADQVGHRAVFGCHSFNKLIDKRPIQLLEGDTMLSYLFIGANDVEVSAQFYSAILSPLGYEKELSEGHYCFSLPETVDKSNGPGSIHIAKPFNGEAAMPGNGIMPALRATSRAQVNEIHAAGLASGGTCAGAPGIREAYTADFYVAYLRDPIGNKVAVFFKG